MTTPPTDTRLFAKDVAERRGTGLRQAQKYLARLEVAHPEAVGKTGFGERRSHRFTTVAALERIDPARVEGVQTRLDALEQAIAELRERCANLERRNRSGR